jgi:FAD/FMN-containing dehydrogenase
MLTETMAPAASGLTNEEIEAFRMGVRGAVIRPGDPAYEDARRVRNGLIDRHPALVVHCGGVADVVEAVNFARQHELLVSVRGGGHNVSGAATNDGGIVIDLSGMRGVPTSTGRRSSSGWRRPAGSSPAPVSAG